MARVFITGSADGLGRLAAETLLDDGHAVVIHVRTRGFAKCGNRIDRADPLRQKRVGHEL